jgi:hypothetical protein
MTAEAGGVLGLAAAAISGDNAASPMGFTMIPQDLV